MTNTHNTVLYTGVTNDLIRRVEEHKEGKVKGFTKKYKCTKLVFVESTPDAMSAIEREKEIKGWNRNKKNELVNSINPNWSDLSFEM